MSGLVLLAGGKPSCLSPALLSGENLERRTRPARGENSSITIIAGFCYCVPLQGSQSLPDTFSQRVLTQVLGRQGGAAAAVLQWSEQGLRGLKSLPT